MQCNYDNYELRMLLIGYSAKGKKIRKYIDFKSYLKSELIEMIIEKNEKLRECNSGLMTKTQFLE